MNQENEMPKAFNAQDTEEKIYKLWEEHELFRPETLESILVRKGVEVKEPFTITLPPPNANGELHLGHTAGYSFQDLMGRYHRMNGHPTLLLPGKDHASIQTEAVFARILEQQGEDKWELGRDEFYRRCYEFCMDAAKSAQKQEKAIGLSADWERDFFTLDPRLTEVIYQTFYDMFEDGLIYRGKYLINQCPHCRTALADVDTEKEERRGIMAQFVYRFVDEADQAAAIEAWGHPGIVVATTRPETMLGDTAVAVHPEDDRYSLFIGKEVIVPFVDRKIEIIADDAIDPEMGTGAVKVTPAHSAVDFEIGRRHDLEIINVIDERGLMTGEIPQEFIGLDTVECSKLLIKKLDERGDLVEVSNYKHDVSVCERCGTPIQPIISYQWFADMSGLAAEVLEDIKAGKVEIIPEGQQSALIHFLENIRPWCISRQLWWGQRIPVWYSGGKKLYDWLQEHPDKTVADWETMTGEKARGTGRVFLGEAAPETDDAWAGKPEELWMEREEDLFDTWFSSGQWPYSTLGGPGADDFEKFYPTQVMETARDILYWWVARMLMLGKYRTGEVPFARVFLHGLIQTEDGSKMSKSKGNGEKPTEIFEMYGADALRLWYYSDCLAGANTPLQRDKIKGHRNFVNKVWNASRYVLFNLDSTEFDGVKNQLNSLSSQWASGEYTTEHIKATADFVEKIHGYMGDMKFHLAVEAIREFFWGEYCDKWIEETKARIDGLEIGDPKRIEELGNLLFLLKQNLKLMHPFMPYVTEAVWQELVKLDLAEDWLIVEQW